MKKQFKRGDQIIYCPNHAMVNGEPDMNHPDIQYGFVTSWREDIGTVFCRYWREKPTTGVPSLRTKANSEGANEENIFHHESTNQVLVAKAILIDVVPSEEINNKILDDLL